MFRMMALEDTASRAQIPGGRVGIADGPVAAAAATRLRGDVVQRVEVGDDRAFLATLPIHALPIGRELCDLLRALGVRGVGTYCTRWSHSLIGR